MKKNLLLAIGVANAAIALFMLVELLFFFKGPIFQFLENIFRGGHIPKPVQFYLILIFGFSLFSIYGLLNRNKYDILFPDMWKNWLVFFFLVCSGIYFTNQYTNIEAFRDWFKEDNFFENMTFALLFAASLFFFMSFILIRSRVPLLANIFIILLAIFCFLFAMEEISWGQRVFGWQTPEKWGEANFQNETNIHNLDAAVGIKRVLRIAFTLSFSMMLGLSLFIRDYLKQWKLEFLIPNQNFFLFAFILPVYHNWHELNEEIFSIIFVFYGYALYTGAKHWKGVLKTSASQ